MIIHMDASQFTKPLSVVEVVAAGIFFNELHPFVYSFLFLPSPISLSCVQSQSMNFIKLLIVAKVLSKKARTIYPPAVFKCWVTASS